MSLEEKIDTSSAAGELVFHVFGAIAHFERRLISERTKEGINAARLKGKIPGRPTFDKEKFNSALKLTPTVFKDSILVTDLMRVYQYGFGN